MKTYQFKMRAYVGSRVCRIGETIQLEDNQAAGLVRLGAIVEIHNSAPVVSESVAPVTPIVPIAIPVVAPVSAPVAEPKIETTTTSTAETTAEPLATVEPMVTAEPAQSGTPSSDSPSNDSNAYGNLTKAQLNAELDKRGIAHDAKATNAELEALLVADDEQKATATATAPVETATATPNA